MAGSGNSIANRGRERSVRSVNCLGNEKAFAAAD
eukprot:COSAG02_NODE_33100_length_505_cov_1.130542_1_plen_33_part_10